MTETATVAAPPRAGLQMRASVLREPGRPPAVETVWLDPPGPGEVLVRIAAAGVCHSDVHLADGALGDGRWPMVMGHEGAGVIEALGEGVTGVRPGDHVVFCLVASCGTCAACRSGHRTLCEPVGAQSVAGNLPTGARRLRDADCGTLQHGLTIACFAERAVVCASSVIPIPHDLPLWQAALLGCGVVTGFGAVTHAAGVRIGERVAVIGCGGVGLQVIAAARLAGASMIVAIDRRAEKLDHALRRGATHAVEASGTDAAAEVVALTDGGVDHAFEVVGASATIYGSPGTACDRAGLPWWSAWRRAASKVSLPAIEFLSEKSIVGSYSRTGGDPALATLPGLVVNLVRTRTAGAATADLVLPHLIDLDGVAEAMDRLRRGEGDRSVIVIDPSLAGATAAQGGLT